MPAIPHPRRGRQPSLYFDHLKLPLGMFDVLLGSSPGRRWAEGLFDSMTTTQYIAAHS
ncbi:hypothetical protein [Micromonospora zamorensis]|uniref:hypothetical protein n=1 Tax=Micromonospora zamorensis TaxID=709883 RepID=UPI00081F77EC|nr:hypothetical protein [Micromonospora zamorensis]WSK48084.1 hypothetical protein OG423_29570 [Micromonospora zamorensis]SCG46450.1 hypothetical protein GA0070619_1838 [Micromonospora zamorensis]